MSTSKEIVKKALEFDNPERAPRTMWALPWAVNHYPDEVATLREKYPSDFRGVPGFANETPKTMGNPYINGEYIDEWGCKFINIQEGIIGEAKEPLIAPDDEDWNDTSKIHIPREWLTIDVDQVNAFCKENDEKFLNAGCCPNPFERMQFIRGTENLYIDLMLRPANMLSFLQELHAFYCEQVEMWCKTDIDYIMFMDDWGAQKNLLINPKTWVELFKPMYKDYIDIAHRYGKKAFMHSDGNILEIYPHLVELGLDALNSQLFCMGVENLAQFKGKITFWGEIDRQHILVTGTEQDVVDAVHLVKDNLWHNGGCIAQCEFGPGAKPELVNKVFETWNKIF
ncbi:MAG: methyltransferase [Clostridiales bacterium]|nr:methyltransferase [Clostridiales bacterium]